MEVWKDKEYVYLEEVEERHWPGMPSSEEDRRRAGAASWAAARWSRAAEPWDAVLCGVMSWGPAGASSDGRGVGALAATTGAAVLA